MGTKMIAFHVTFNPLLQTAAEMGGPYPFLLFLQLRKLHQLVGFALWRISKPIWLALWSRHGWILRKEEAGTCSQAHRGSVGTSPIPWLLD